MLLNYLKLAIRLLIRNPFFTFINVIGLSVGYAVFFILFQYAQTELNSDQFHKDYERIYRIRTQFNAFNPDGQPFEYSIGASHPVFAQIVKDKFAEIESMCRISNQNNFDDLRIKEHDTRIIFSYIDEKRQKHSFLETRAAYADPNLFQFFSIPLVMGNSSSVLLQPEAIVLSKTTALRYFGEANPLGKVLLLNDSIPFTVTGVFGDLPSNSHLTFQLVMSGIHIQKALEREQPFQRGVHCYFRVRRDATLSMLEEKIDAESRVQYEEYLRRGWPGSVLKVYLQPLAEIPFSVYDNDVYVPKSKYVLYIFHVVAILVLIVALINHLNLNLAAQAKRLKEFAARKTVGARLSDFIKQFT